VELGTCFEFTHPDHYQSWDHVYQEMAVEVNCDTNFHDDTNLKGGGKAGKARTKGQVHFRKTQIRSFVFCVFQTLRFVMLFGRSLNRFLIFPVVCQFSFRLLCQAILKLRGAGKHLNPQATFVLGLYLVRSFGFRCLDLGARYPFSKNV
jgi:hypothetical protein